MQHTLASWRLNAMTRCAAAAAVTVTAAAASCLLPTPVHAHGALLKYQMTLGVSLQATYDTGEPMTAAQFTVYAPSDPTTPWLTGKSDAQGRFSFVPDASIPGMWAVQAREAGHGALVQISIGDTNTSGNAAAATAYASAPATMMHAQGANPAQRWIMAASVIWGFIGTALFFTRKKAS